MMKHMEIDLSENDCTVIRMVGDWSDPAWPGMGELVKLLALRSDLCPVANLRIDFSECEQAGHRILSPLMWAGKWLIGMGRSFSIDGANAEIAATWLSMGGGRIETAEAEAEEAVAG